MKPPRPALVFWLAFTAAAACRPAGGGSASVSVSGGTIPAAPLDGTEIVLPDPDIVLAYRQAAAGNVIAAINPKVFFGYWSVCADGKDFGYGCTYPSLDGHQMTDALLWLGRVDVVKANWDYVRSFQRPDGSLPLAILPSSAGTRIGGEGHEAAVAVNGGLYEHWVPGNPLRALADPTYIQNADDIFRMTQDEAWLKAQLPSVNRTADHLASMVGADGAVGGAGYYIERPARIERDGVAQCHAVDAFHRAAALNRAAGDAAKAEAYDRLAERIKRYFTTRFWLAEKGRFAEYDHPERGLISSHGLTDVDWTAIALNTATPEQTAVLWPKLKDEPLFYYGGMPTGIATHPEAYQAWEFTFADRYDLAAMGRVWYLEAQARARRGDAEGLRRGIQAVCREGAKNGYYWRERYKADDQGAARGLGANKYCEYPANLIRIVQRFLLGVDFRRDGTLVLAPAATDGYWESGFGQTLRWRGRVLDYRMRADRVSGTYAGDGPQALVVRLEPGGSGAKIRAFAAGRRLKIKADGEFVSLTLPASPQGKLYPFEVRGIGPLKPS
ncbi:MAG: hypothetical protein PHI34_09245 [Acidobacteriota bacterium]|nr:hypothetical protein [Acidobacteriota bacterium]